MNPVSSPPAPASGERKLRAQERRRAIPFVLMLLLGFAIGLGLGLSVGKGGALFLKLGRERLDHVLPPRRGGRTGELPDNAGDLFAGVKHWVD